MNANGDTAALLDAIFARRSIRRYQDRPVPRALIEQALNAAIWAPSAHNRQPWRFAVVETPDVKERLARAMGDRLRADLTADGVPADLIEKDTARSYARITAAPVAVALCLSLVDMDTYPDERRSRNEFLMAVQSVALAGQNFLLAAHAVGLGACWLCAPLFVPDVVRAALDLPGDWQPQALLTLGFPAEQREKSRHPLEKSVVWR